MKTISKLWSRLPPLASLIVLLLATIGNSGFAQTANPAPELQKLQAEYQAAQQEFNRLYRAAKSSEERLNVQEKNPLRTFIPRFLKLAQAHPGQPAGFDALLWIVANGEGGPDYQQAFELLSRDYAGQERLAGAVQTLAEFSIGAVPQLRRILEKSPHAPVQALACFYLARALKESSPAESEQLFDRFLTQYAAVRLPRGNLVATAKKELNDVRYLSIGKVAPEITGEDIEGKTFKLSEYRGKVVLLNFWGDW